MLAKSRRLTSSEVEEVLSKGVSIRIPLEVGKKSLISVKFLAKSGSFKAVAVAPKSVVKSAVVRNRLRRAIYRALASLPSPKKGGTAVFFVRAIPKKPLTPAFLGEIEAALQRISS